MAGLQSGFAHYGELRKRRCPFGHGRRRPAVTKRTTTVSATRSHSTSTTKAALVWDIGLDVGDRKSHYCMLERTTGEMREGQVVTTAEALEKFFKPLVGSRVVLEVGSQSRWIQKFF